MNTLYLFTRTTTGVKKSFLYPVVCIKDIYCAKTTKDDISSSSSSDSSSSDDEAKKTKRISAAEVKREESRNKLNSLLQQIIQEEVVQSQAKLDLAQPTNKRIKKKAETETVNNKSVEKQIISAVKNVAKDIGVNVKQTESELLLKLLGPSDNSTLNSSNLSDIVKGMKIDRESKPAEQSRSDQIRSLLQRVKSKQTTDIPERRTQRGPAHSKQRPEMVVQKIDLFASEPLGIFTNKELKEESELRTWGSLYQRDLKLAVTHPPSNYFQEMILWTEQGKLWKFPIDNEQGLDEEKKVDFTEHIFLEEHLEPWCPQKGPLRHFMELVCVGLSKNPYLTVSAKKEHIEWYKNYFEEKKKLLEEVGAMPMKQESQKFIK